MAHRITDDCTGCATCAQRCPTEAISGDRRGLHVIDPGRCIDCGTCGVVCPDEAVRDNHGKPCVALAGRRWPRAYVDLETCVGCEWCVTACAFDALTMEDNPAAAARASGIVGRDEVAPARIAVVLARRCVGCNLCEAECAYGAIRVLREDAPEVTALMARNDAHLAQAGVAPASIVRKAKGAAA